MEARRLERIRLRFGSNLALFHIPSSFAARMESLIVAEVHLPALDGAMSRKGSLQVRRLPSQRITRVGVKEGDGDHAFGITTCRTSV